MSDNWINRHKRYRCLTCRAKNFNPVNQNMRFGDMNYHKKYSPSHIIREKEEET